MNKVEKISEKYLKLSESVSSLQKDIRSCADKNEKSTFENRFSLLNESYKAIAAEYNQLDPSDQEKTKDRLVNLFENLKIAGQEIRLFGQSCESPQLKLFSQVESRLSSSSSTQYGTFDFM
jgi:hypothetical protein